MNQDYDFSIHFAFTITVFKLCSSWRPDEDMKYKKLYYCYTALLLTMTTIFLVSQIIYIYNNRNSVQEVSATLYITITFTSITIRELTFYKKINYIKLMVKSLNSPLFQVKCQKHYEIAENTNGRYRKLYNVCLFLGSTTDVLIAIFPFMADEKTVVANGWFPYDWTKPLNYILTYIFQVVVLVYQTITSFCLHIFTCTLLVQVGVQCDILCHTLNHLDDFHTEDGVLHEISMERKLELRGDKEKFSDDMYKNLVICIRHHKEIIRFAKDIQRIIEVGVFVIFTSGALILCTCMFQLFKGKIGLVESCMLLFYLLCMLVEQGLCCWFGNEVIFKSALILESAYNTPWVNCNTKFRKILLQFMIQTCRPISIVAGRLFTMSVSVFISVMKTSYSYFTLLQRIQEK